MQEIGRVYGEVIQNKFTFSSKELYGKKFVKIELGQGEHRIIGKIVEKRSINKFLSNPDIVKYINDDMNYSRDTIYSYSAVVIGTIHRDLLLDENLSALPGLPVFEALVDEIKIVYGIAQSGIKVGYMRETPECSVHLDIDKIFQPHLMILGKTGSGKSYFTKGLLNQFADVKYYIFSPSDEYNKEVKDKKTKILSDIVLPLNTDNLSYYLNLNVSEELILQKIVFEDERVYSVQEIITCIIMYYKKNTVKKNSQLTLDLGIEKVQDFQIPQYAQSLIQKLKNLRKVKFAKSNTDITSVKNSIIFDMTEYTQLEQECILNYYLYKILKSCKATKTSNRKKKLIFIEEAHNFVPSIKNTLCKEIIVRLAREGRKYGISLCFITQRPRNFDQTALSQSSNKIVFSIPHPDDIRHIMDDASYYHSEIGSIIQNQRQGQCVIIGDAFQSEVEMKVKFDDDYENE